MSVLLNGILFQKAVLDWDLKTGREHADKCMVEMFDHVVNQFSKAGAVSAKLVVEVPEVSQEGPFTFKKEKKKGWNWDRQRTRIEKSHPSSNLSWTSAHSHSRIQLPRQWFTQCEVWTGSYHSRQSWWQKCCWRRIAT